LPRFEVKNQTRLDFKTLHQIVMAGACSYADGVNEGTMMRQHGDVVRRRWWVGGVDDDGGG